MTVTCHQSWTDRQKTYWEYEEVSEYTKRTIEYLQTWSIIGIGIQRLLLAKAAKAFAIGT
jgi:hypothetical protein